MKSKLHSHRYVMDDCPGFIWTDGGSWFIGSMKPHARGRGGKGMLHHCTDEWEKRECLTTRAGKRALSERGQGGSVAGDADNLSQRGPLAALCPNLCRKWGETGRYVSPPLLLLLLGSRLLSHSVLPTLCALWSGSGILFPSLVFCYYFPLVYISFLAACETSEQWCG